ncbi:MAG: hypothetical protein K0Q94_3974 [Paenibacillus sp.]|nr:hypothetical protein [Paenibacillus sp.]
MTFLLRPCELEMNFKSYIEFLLQHHAELNLPYSFAMKLSFVGSPLIFGKAMLAYEEESYETVGAAGFVYGTGANGYEDRHICQVEVAFILAEYRRTSLFVQGLRALIDLIREGNPEVEQVQFWTAADPTDTDKLFAKFSALPGSTRSVVNELAFYTISFRELEAYCRRFERRTGLA